MGLDKNPRSVLEAGKQFSLAEVPTGRLWVDGKPIFRKVVDFGALPNAATKDVAHGVVTPAFFVHVYGIGLTISGTGVSFPLPNVGALVETDGTNVSVTAPGDLSGYTASYVVLEYTKA